MDQRPPIARLQPADPRAALLSPLLIILIKVEVNGQRGREHDGPLGHIERIIQKLDAEPA